MRSAMVSTVFKCPEHRPSGDFRRIMECFAWEDGRATAGRRRRGHAQTSNGARRRGSHANAEPHLSDRYQTAPGSYRRRSRSKNLSDVFNRYAATRDHSGLQ